MKLPSGNTHKIELSHLSECSNSNLTHPYKIWGPAMFIKLKTGMKPIGNQAGNPYFLFPRLLPVPRLWLPATGTGHVSTSALIQAASVAGSPNTDAMQLETRLAADVDGASHHTQPLEGRSQAGDSNSSCQARPSRNWRGWAEALTSANAGPGKGISSSAQSSHSSL